MEAVFFTPWQHSKLSISSLIKFDSALRQQCGPGDLQRFLQTSVIQCFQRPPDGRGTRLWYFEILRIHDPNPHEANRESEGGTRSPAGSGKDACEAGIPASTAIPRRGRTASVAGKARDGRAGMETGSSGRVEANPPETRLRLHGEDSAQRGQCSPTSHRSCQELERREKQTPRSILTLCPASPCGCAQPGSASTPGLVRRLPTARRRQAPRKPVLRRLHSGCPSRLQPALAREPSSLRPRSAARCRGGGAEIGRAHV